MNRFALRSSLFLFLLFLLQASAWAQASSPVRSQEISEVDGLPVLIKHLPEWQNVRSSTVFITNSNDLKNTVGNRPVLDLIGFSGGTEAVTANYPAGRLLIVEFATPQGSVDTDTKIFSHIAAAPEPGLHYRRIGNYNVFVFDSPDENAARALLDQVKYEKAVQWLGEDPFLLQKFERYFINTTRDIFISTVLWIVACLGFAAVSGVIAGYIFFRIREQRRANWQRFSDAGGLTRLNLDELSE